MEYFNKILTYPTCKGGKFVLYLYCKKRETESFAINNTKTYITMATQKAFDIISPDGIGMYFDKVFTSPETAEIGFKEWAKRFEHQGYYRNNQWQQIPLNQLREHCRLIELEIDLDDFEGDII